MLQTGKLFFFFFKWEYNIPGIDLRKQTVSQTESLTPANPWRTIYFLLKSGVFYFGEYHLNLMLTCTKKNQDTAVEYDLFEGQFEYMKDSHRGHKTRYKSRCDSLTMAWKNKCLYQKSADSWIESHDMRILTPPKQLTYSPWHNFISWVVIRCNQQTNRIDQFGCRCKT